MFTLIGPNGAGKTTVFNLISRIYAATSGSIDSAAPLRAVALQRIAGLGIAHVPNISCSRRHLLQNPLIAATSTAAAASERDVFAPSVRAAERDTRRKVEEVIDTSTCSTTATMWPVAVRRSQGRELARALANRGAPLLLDEPSSA